MSTKKTTSVERPSRQPTSKPDTSDKQLEIAANQQQPISVRDTVSPPSSEIPEEGKGSGKSGS